MHTKSHPSPPHPKHAAADRMTLCIYGNGLLYHAHGALGHTPLLIWI